MPATDAASYGEAPTLIRRCRCALQLRDHTRDALLQRLGRELFAKDLDDQRERERRRSRGIGDHCSAATKARERVGEAGAFEMTLEHLAHRLHEELVVGIELREHVVDESARRLELPVRLAL